VTRVPERVVQAHVVQALRSVGGFVLTLGTTRPKGDYAGTCQSLGWPDVGAFLPHSPTGTLRHWLWVEVKASGGRLRPEQAAFRARCLERNIPHIVGGLDDVLAYLLARGYVTEYAHYRKTGVAS